MHHVHAVVEVLAKATGFNQGAQVAVRGADQAKVDINFDVSPKPPDTAIFPHPIWGPGHDIAKFGHAKGLFEYLQLMMPFDDPSKLNDSQKTAIVAYMLVQNGTLRPGANLPLGGDLSAIK